MNARRSELTRSLWVEHRPCGAPRSMGVESRPTVIPLITLLLLFVVWIRILGGTTPLARVARDDGLAGAQRSAPHSGCGTPRRPTARAPPRRVRGRSLAAHGGPACRRRR